MEILKKNENGLERSYLIALSRAEIEKEELAELQKIRAKVRMDGFRPGKVPFEIIKKMYGAGVERDAKTKAVEKAAKSVLSGETNLSFGSNTKIMKDDENGVEFELNFEKVPTFELKDFSEIKLEKLVAEITDEDVEKELEELRKKLKKWVKDESGSSVQKGQKITADVSSSSKHLKNDIKSFEVEIDDENIMDEFRRPFIGTKCGDTVKFVVHYPKNYHQKKFAGKNVDYIAIVKAVFNSDEYKLDDEFAKVVGFNDLNDAKKMVRESLTRKYTDLSNSILKRDLLEKITEMYDFNVPGNMLKVEISDVTRQIGEEADKLGKEMTDEIRTECEKIARDRIRLGFVIAEIAKKNRIVATRNEINSAITYLIHSNPRRKQELLETYRNPVAFQTLASSIIENKTADFILKNLNGIEELTVSVAELIAKDEEKLDCFKEEEEKAADEEKKRSGKAANTKETEKQESVKSSDESSEGEEKLGEKSAKPSNGKRKTFKEEGDGAEKTVEKKVKKTTAKKV